MKMVIDLDKCKLIDYEIISPKNGGPLAYWAVISNGNSETTVNGKAAQRVIEFFKPEYIISQTTLNKVIQDLRDREQLGKERYGTTVDRTDMSREEWEQHLYEELLDAVMYLRRIKKD